MEYKIWNRNEMCCNFRKRIEQSDKTESRYFNLGFYLPLKPLKTPTTFTLNIEFHEL